MSDSAPDDHLDPAEVIAYARGRITEDVRTRLERHLARCRACVAEVVAVGREQRASRRPIALALGGLIAASLAAIWFATARPTTPVSPVDERGPADTPAALQVIEPANGAIAGDATSFIWRPAPEAITYRVTVTDSAGAEVWSATTSDTVALAPEQSALDRGRTYFWFVDALRKDGRSVSSGLQHFRTPP